MLKSLLEYISDDITIAEFEVAYFYCSFLVSFLFLVYTNDIFTATSIDIDTICSTDLQT